MTFQVGQKIRAKLRKDEVVVQGEDRIKDRYRYTVLAVEGTRIGIDDGDPATRWPASLFVSDE